MDQRTARLMSDEHARAGMAADEFDREFLRAHLTDERRKASWLGEVREAIFGAQDGLVSTVAGEYIGSKSQREIFDAQIVDEREEVHERPGEAEAEVAYMFEEDGLPHEDAREVARIMAGHPDVLLKTMVEKELSPSVEE